MKPSATDVLISAMETLSTAAENADVMVIICDSEGLISWRSNELNLTRRLGIVGFVHESLKAEVHKLEFSQEDERD